MDLDEAINTASILKNQFKALEKLEETLRLAAEVNADLPVRQQKVKELTAKAVALTEEVEAHKKALTAAKTAHEETVVRNKQRISDLSRSLEQQYAAKKEKLEADFAAEITTMREQLSHLHAERQRAEIELENLRAAIAAEQKKFDDIRAEMRARLLGE